MLFSIHVKKRLSTFYFFIIAALSFHNSMMFFHFKKTSKFLSFYVFFPPIKVIISNGIPILYCFYNAVYLVNLVVFIFIVAQCCVYAILFKNCLPFNPNTFVDRLIFNTISVLSLKMIIP